MLYQNFEIADYNDGWTDVLDVNVKSHTCGQTGNKCF